MKYWNEVIAPAFNNIIQDIIGVLPELAGAIFILIFGWILAKILGKGTDKLLTRLGLNSVAEKAGIDQFLKKSGFNKNVTEVIGKIVFWAIFMMFLLSAAETLQLSALANTIQMIVSYIPNLIVIILILVFGSLAARLVGQLVQGSAASAGIDFAELLGKLVKNFILIAIFVISISQLELQTAILDYVFISVLGAISVAIALALGLGARSVAKALIQGVYARKHFKIGQKVTIDNFSGTISQIGTVSSLIKTSDKMISIPNARLIDGNVIIESD